jgi:hypothetical protein
MTLEECVARACEQVPGLRQGVALLLPEGLLVSGVGSGDSFEREPLVRSAARCLGVAATGDTVPSGTRIVEHLLVSRDELVVLLQGILYPRLALALLCTTEFNPALVLSSSRSALRMLEATIDLSAWEV